MDDKTHKLIDDYLGAVLEANEHVNLTRIVDKETARILHVEDSLAVLPEVEASPMGPYGDLGSGSGFPGVPLALASGRAVTLVESVKKKCQVVEGIVNQLGLGEKVSVFAGRSEDLALQHPSTFALLTARALAPLPSLLELASPLLMSNGKLVCLKGPDVDDELEWALGLEEKLGMRMASRRDYVLSDGKTQRTVVVFAKAAEARVKLPRRPGAAQTHPYKS